MATVDKKCKKNHDNFQQIIDECIEKAKSGKYIFRGMGSPCVLSDNNNTIQSTLYRKYKSKDMPCTNVDFFEIEREIISQARYLFDPSDKDIKILTELRHFGDDLAIIDFTKNIFIGLYFACRYTLNNQKNDNDGEIVFLETPQLNVEIDYAAENYYAIEPVGKGMSFDRASAQKSIFIHTRQGFINPKDLAEKVCAINIENKFKGKILDYLNNVADVNIKSMFKDVVGFIENKKHINPIEYQMGVSALKSHDYKKAFDLFDGVIKDNPHSYRALNSRGISLFGLNQPEKSIDDYSKAIEINPTYDVVYSNRGNARYKIGDVDGALLDHTKAIELNPNNIDAFLVRGTIYAGLKKYKEALADSFSASSIDPKSSAAIYLHDIARINLNVDADMFITEEKTHKIKEYISEAIKYINNRIYGLGIDECKKALELDSKNRYAYMLRAEIRFKMNNFEGAAYDFYLVVTLIKAFYEDNKSELMHSLYYLGLAKIKNLKVADGVDDLSELLELNPDDILALVKRGHALHSLGKSKESRNDTEGALELFNKALVDLNKAVLLDPELIEALYNRALVNKSLGNSKQAEEDLDKCKILEEKLSPDKDSQGLFNPDIFNAF